MSLKVRFTWAATEFIERHSAEDKELKEIPRAQLKRIQADIGTDLCEEMGKPGSRRAYREHGYRLQEIAANLGVHYATVSRKLKKIERRT